MHFTLNPDPPFRLDLTVWVLRRRPANRIDLYDGKTHRRVLVLGGAPALIEVEQTGTANAPRLLVTVWGEDFGAEIERSVAETLTRMLGLNRDLTGFYELAKANGTLGALARPFSGVRPPRYPSLFEAIANGIIGQQISLHAAMNILSRFTEAYGRPLNHEGRTFFAFPEPIDIVERSPVEIQKAGLTANKARALAHAAGVIADGKLSGAEIESMSNEEASLRLKELRGIGSWTADYILLRGFGRLDIFPGNDSGALKSLNKWLNPDAAVSFSDLMSVVSSWYPYQGLVYFHLLLRKLAEERLIA